MTSTEWPSTSKNPLHLAIWEDVHPPAIPSQALDSSDVLQFPAFALLPRVPRSTHGCPHRKDCAPCARSGSGAAGRPCWTSTWEAPASASPTGSARRRSTSTPRPPPHRNPPPRKARTPPLERGVQSPSTRHIPHSPGRPGRRERSGSRTAGTAAESGPHRPPSHTAGRSPGTWTSAIGTATGAVFTACGVRPPTSRSRRAVPPTRARECAGRSTAPQATTCGTPTSASPPAPTAPPSPRSCAAPSPPIFRRLPRPDRRQLASRHPLFQERRVRRRFRPCRGTLPQPPPGSDVGACCLPRQHVRTVSRWS